MTKKKVPPRKTPPYVKSITVRITPGRLALLDAAMARKRARDGTKASRSTIGYLALLEWLKKEWIEHTPSCECEGAASTSAIHDPHDPKCPWFIGRACEHGNLPGHCRWSTCEFCPTYAATFIPKQPSAKIA